MLVSNKMLYSVLYSLDNIIAKKVKGMMKCVYKLLNYILSMKYTSIKARLL